MTVQQDIDEAWRQAGSPAGSTVALRRLPTLLAEDEGITALAPGYVGSASGVLAVTTERLLFVTRTVATTVADGFALADLVHVEATAKGAASTLIVATEAEELLIERVSEADATELGAVIEDEMQEPAPPPPPMAAATRSPLAKSPARPPISARPPLPPPAAAVQVPYPMTPIPVQPTTPAKRNWFIRHKVLTGFGALVVLVIAISVSSSGGGGTASSPPSSTASGGTAAKSAGLGTPVRDGKFEFVVQSFKCGQKMVGSQALGRTAQGQFCTAKVSVKNTSGEAQALFSSNQKLIDAAGRQYDTDDAALFYVNEGGSLFSNINPGNSVAGTVIFDVPKDFKASKLELHDSALSGGVNVTVM